MIYEQRIIIIIPGKEEEFISRARKWLSIAQKCGARITTDIFQTIIGNNHEFSYIMAYDSLAHREKVFQSMEQDQEIKALHETLAKEGYPVYNISNRIMKSIEYSDSK